MSKKSKDEYNRYRCITVVFRISLEENKNLDRMVALSELTKQRYIISRLENKELVVHPNPRIYKGVKNLLVEILDELKRLETGAKPESETLEIIRVVANAFDDMKGV